MAAAAAPCRSADLGMRVRRADEDRMRGCCPGHVIGVAAAPGDQPPILDPAHGLPEPEACHPDLATLPLVTA